MDSLPASSSSSFFRPPSLSPQLSKAQADLTLIKATLSYKEASDDAVSVSFGNLYGGLPLTAGEIVDKLNELLKAKLPDGIQSLAPDQVTPEATAERIVLGATAFFAAYAKQHPELEGEELLKSFLETINSGIQKGYDEAYSILEALGAFQFDGVRQGVEKTKELIAQKLKAWEDFKRQEMGLAINDPAPKAKDEMLIQGGTRVWAASHAA